MLCGMCGNIGRRNKSYNVDTWYGSCVAVVERNNATKLISFIGGVVVQWTRTTVTKFMRGVGSVVIAEKKQSYSQTGKGCRNSTVGTMQQRSDHKRSARKLRPFGNSVPSNRIHLDSWCFRRTLSELCNGSMIFTDTSLNVWSGKQN